MAEDKLRVISKLVDLPRAILDPLPTIAIGVLVDNDHSVASCTSVWLEGYTIEVIYVFQKRGRSGKGTFPP